MVNGIYLFRELISFFIPDICSICKKKLDLEGLCPDCWNKIEFILDPCCFSCGYPFSTSIESYNDVLSMAPKAKGGKILCANCLANDSGFIHRSACVYNEYTKKLILPFKHGDKEDLASIISNLFKQLIYNPNNFFLKEIDLLIPVPIHIRRLYKRKYNQSAILSNYLVKLINDFHKKDIKVRNDFLLRHKNTLSQGGLSFSNRKKNVKNSFSCNLKADNLIGKSVLLIDDVWTTGATIKECAKTLKKAGIKNVYAITFARVIK